MRCECKLRNWSRLQDHSRYAIGCFQHGRGRSSVGAGTIGLLNGYGAEGYRKRTGEVVVPPFDSLDFEIRLE